MSAKPWFKLHVAEFWGDAVGMTASQRGAYISLLCYYWEHEGLPDNDEKLARIAGMQMKEWRRNRPSMVSLFGPSWDHQRMNSLLQEWMEKVNQCKAAGQRSFNVRSASVITIGQLRARASESDKKNLEGESESNQHHHQSDSEGTRRESQRRDMGQSRAMSPESRNVAATHGDSETFQRAEPPEGAFEQERVKRPDELTRAEYEEMLAKKKPAG